MWMNKNVNRRKYFRSNYRTKTRQIFGNFLVFPSVLESGAITNYETALYPENLVSFEKYDVKKADFFQELNIFLRGRIYNCL